MVYDVSAEKLLSLGDHPSSSAGGALGSGAAPPTHINPASAPYHGSLSGITRLIQGLDSEKTREQSLDLLCKARNDNDTDKDIHGGSDSSSYYTKMDHLVKWEGSLIRMNQYFCSMIDRYKHQLQIGSVSPQQISDWANKILPNGETVGENRQACDEMAILLWNSFGTMKLLLQEITSVYRPLLSNSLSERAVTQVCNAIALLQSVASHPDTRMPFIKASMPVYLYPFLNTMNCDRNYEFLRLTSLGVIGSLAKVDDAEVVDYLLSTQIFPSCLRCMEVGRTLSKTVATYIIYRILLSEKGLKYCFILADRYLSVSHALAIMVERLAEEDKQNSRRLLRNIIGCYLRLSENERTRQRLSSYIPSKLVDNTYINILRGDTEALSNLQQLIYNLKTSQMSQSSSMSLGPFIR